MPPSSHPIPFSEYLKVVLIADPSDPRVSELIEQEGFSAYEIEVSEDYHRNPEGDSDVGAYIIAVDGEQREQAQQLAKKIRATGNNVPLWALADQFSTREIEDFSLVGEIAGFIYLGKQTPSYYVRQVITSISEYGNSLMSPFFGGMMAYDWEANIAFDCPGHQGGQFYRKSPAGQMFFKHLGERIFRNDLCNADVDLGDLLIHEGAAVEAQKNAARVFGADKTYFVLNGTSTSNKVVQNAVVGLGDLVLFDRNNHKSNHHGSLVQGGGIPIYLPTARNAFGMVGAMDWDAFDEDYLREQIRKNPLVKDKSKADAKRPFRCAVIQLATYDGTVYNCERVMQKIGHLCDYILWDEAWIGYNAFHPLFKGHSPMRIEDLGPDAPGLFSTQSVHKQLAGFSQASQIHKKDKHLKGQQRYIEHKRFNEAFMLHASTSPFYPIFASLDVNAKIHEGKSGEVLWDKCIELTVETRKKFRAIGHHFEAEGKDEQEQWFFDPFVPDVVSVTDSEHTQDLVNVRWEDIPTEVIKREQQCWAMSPSSKWHGYDGYVEGYCMVDPNKLSLLTPGIDRQTGNYLDFGLPATVVANYLREQRIIPEKCDLNSILFLMTPAEDESKMNSLIAKLVRFKELWDRDVPMSEVLPTIYAAHEERYAGYSIRQICNEMHNFYKAADIQGLQKAVFRAEHFPEPALSPQEAIQAQVANRVDYLPLDQIKGRIAAMMALIYPPGIGVIVPGERWDDRAQPMLDYFLTFQESFNRFPGFAYEVQGVFQELDDHGKIRFYTYAVKE